MKQKILSILKLNGFSPARKIAMSFFIVIFLGAFLLTLPISNADGNFLAPIDALFTATSATCVTGLVIAPTFSQFTLFGQIIIICLIQIGGLGLMTLVASFALALKNRMSMKNKIAMREMLNHSQIHNFKSFLFNILKFTFAFEALGAFILSIEFIPEFGLLKGVYISIFTAISAFCNAGFDVIGASSLEPYTSNIIVNFTVMALIVCGGVGFIVWFDLKDKLIPFLQRKVSFRRFHHSLSLQTKLVIVATATLIIVPTLLILIVEFDNANTIGSFNLFDKVMGSMFGAVTIRTAGFANFDYGLLHPASQLLMIVVMFIGGSPGGTAGGVKTVTIIVIVMSVVCSLKGKQRTSIFRRHISRDVIVRATSIIAINLAVLITGIFILLINEPYSFMELTYEAVSALATVGLTLGITPSLSFIGKIVIIMLMFVGRIGIMTFIISIIKPEPEAVIEYADGNVMVG